MGGVEAGGDDRGKGYPYALKYREEMVPTPIQSEVVCDTEKARLRFG